MKNINYIGWVLVCGTIIFLSLSNKVNELRIMSPILILILANNACEYFWGTLFSKIIKTTVRATQNFLIASMCMIAAMFLISLGVEHGRNLFLIIGVFSGVVTCICIFNGGILMRDVKKADLLQASREKQYKVIGDIKDLASYNMPRGEIDDGLR